MERAPMRVLIAEDDPVSRRILEKMLENWGYEVLSADDGAQGWALYRENADIQLVISDWMMPNIDGPGLCRLVRSISDRSYAYFILLTARSQVDDIVEGMMGGADDFITKPFNQHELKVRLKAGERLIRLENELAKKVIELSDLNSQMLGDLEASASILQQLMPHETGELPGVRYASRLLPCAHIGGDLLNIFSFDEDAIGAYVLDISGHGVPAALEAVSLSMVLSPHDPHTSLLLRHGRKTGSKYVLPPNDVATNLNSWVEQAGLTDTFMTFLYGVLNPGNGEFTFVRAGHQYPIHLSDGELQDTPKYDGIPIGVVPDAHYEEQLLRLKKGDRIYFYTDGLTEAMDGNGNQFGDRSIREYLRNNYDRSLEDSVSALLDEIREWQDGGERTDDVSILGIEYDP
jgi:sigma-B regulation protein RsbU (phosphoserine phosphatase)